MGSINALNVYWEAVKLLVKPSTIGAPVTLTPTQALMAQTNLSMMEAETFLNSLSDEQYHLIMLAQVDPAGDEMFKKAVMETYNQYYNGYQSTIAIDPNNAVTNTGGNQIVDGVLTNTGGNQIVDSGVPNHTGSDAEPIESPTHMESGKQKDDQIWTEGKVNDPVVNAYDHWNKHKVDFPELQNAKQYVDATHDFVNNPPVGTQTKIRSNGDTLYYNPTTNTFAVKDSNGVPKTMYKPEKGIEYWKNQK